MKVHLALPDGLPLRLEVLRQSNALGGLPLDDSDGMVLLLIPKLEKAFAGFRPILERGEERELISDFLEAVANVHNHPGGNAYLIENASKLYPDETKHFRDAVERWRSLPVSKWKWFDLLVRCGCPMFPSTTAAIVPTDAPPNLAGVTESERKLASKEIAAMLEQIVMGHWEPIRLPTGEMFDKEWHRLKSRRERVRQTWQALLSPKSTR